MKVYLIIVFILLLQQYLPLAVLKPIHHIYDIVACAIVALQQYLPLAVLKLTKPITASAKKVMVATVLTACGIETIEESDVAPAAQISCNSTYRLRY